MEYHIYTGGSKSENRLWLKLDKRFFGFEEDLYVCAVYIPPMNSTHNDNDYLSLESEILNFCCKGKILLMGDFNSRTGVKADFIENDSVDLNDFDQNNVLPKGMR